MEQLESRNLLSVTAAWIEQLGMANGSLGYGVSADNLGSVYSGGTSGGDAFINRYDSSGALLWSRLVGITSGNEFGYGVSADDLGNVYIAGDTSGNFGGTNAGGLDAFLCKYNSGGTLLWTRQLGSAGGDSCYGVSADGLGSVYITGYTYGNLAGTNAGNEDAFLSKYDANGTLLWTRQLGTSSTDVSHSVSADGFGNVYIAGQTGGNLGGTNLGSYDAFLSKYNASGTLLWTKQLGSIGNDIADGVSTDSSGNVYIAGQTTGNLGGTNAGGYDAFIAKYNSSGTLIWTRQIGTTSDDRGLGVSTDGLGNTIITGHTLGNLGGTNVGSDDGFVAKYSAAGTNLWTTQFGTSAVDVSRAVSADAVGNIYVSGRTYGSLGGPNSGSVDAFTIRFGELFLVNTTSDTVDANPGDGVAADSSGNTSLRAAIQEANALGGGVTIQVPAGVYALTITGTEVNDSTNNDLDITSDVTIIGAGAGLTVINGSGLNANGVNSDDRIIQVTGASASLHLSRVTLTGATASETGGGLLVNNSASAELDQVAIVGNTATGTKVGGGIRSGPGTTLVVRNSVLTGNTASTGGAIYTDGTSITLEASIFAQNTGTRKNVSKPVATTLVNNGNNLVDDNAGNLFSTSLGDHVGTVSYVVSSVADAIDANLADSVAQASSGFTTLRAGVQEANDQSGTDIIWLPAWLLNLTVTGTEVNDSTNNDLDITSDVTIIGAGAGLTVINGSGLNANGINSDDRIIQVTGASAALHLSRVTLTGATASETGGGLLVNNNASADLDQVAIVGNTATGTKVGGGIRSGPGTTLVVRNSVLTGNTASTGGAIYTDGTSITLEASIFAQNTGTRKNVSKPVATTLVNNGNNLVDDNAGNLFSTSLGDHVGSVNYVVTCRADTYDQVDNAYSLSLREAVRLANINSGAQTIWAPAWLLRLAREGTDGTSNDVSIGDLDVLENLTVRGSHTSKTTINATAIIDAAFQAIGSTITFDRLTVID